MSRIDISALAEGVDQLGMAIFGSLLINRGLYPDGRDNFVGRQALVIGNRGGAMWKPFSASAEYADGKPDAMDRWTCRVMERLANRSQTHTIFPFDRPYWPFQRMLAAATGMKQSPLGPYIHSRYGLSVALRGAFVLPEGQTAELQSIHTLEANAFHPCESCEIKPCLQACPVNAFDQGLDVSVCFPHLDSGNEPDCMNHGCAARNACPVGRHFAYENAQIRFHMAAYRGD